MNAVTHLHLPLKGDFYAALIDDLQRSDSIFAAARGSRGGHRQSRQPTR